MTKKPSIRDLLSDPFLLLAFGFGAGLSPVAPGTIGTLVGVIFFMLLKPFPVIIYLAIVIAIVLFGIWLCGRIARQLGVEDHPGIVWDEIAGYLLTMFAAPEGIFYPILGFILFRTLDITKPWLIGTLDRHLDGGAGIMLDDVLAGILACGILQSCAWMLR